MQKLTFRIFIEIIPEMPTPKDFITYPRRSLLTCVDWCRCHGTGRRDPFAKQGKAYQRARDAMYVLSNVLHSLLQARNSKPISLSQSEMTGVDALDIGSAGQCHSSGQFPLQNVGYQLDTSLAVVAHPP